MSKIFKIISILVLVLFFSTSYAFAIDGRRNDNRMPDSGIRIEDNSGAESLADRLNAFIEGKPDTGAHSICDETDCIDARVIRLDPENK